MGEADDTAAAEDYASFLGREFSRMSGAAKERPDLMCNLLVAYYSSWMLSSKLSLIPPGAPCSINFI